MKLLRSAGRATYEVKCESDETKTKRGGGCGAPSPRRNAALWRSAAIASSVGAVAFTATIAQIDASESVASLA